MRALGIPTLLTVMALALSHYFGSEGSVAPDNRLADIQERGHIIMLTRNGASSYFLDGAGPSGPEYTLARGFADSLGVDLRVRVVREFGDLDELLKAGEGDLIAANLSKTPARTSEFRFALPYAETHTLVVVRKGLRMPETLEDLEGLRGVVLAGSSYEEWLAQEAGDRLTWESRDNVGVEGLLHAVSEGEFEYTLVDERIFGLQRRYYPGVRTAFTVGEDQELAWAFQRDDDDSLVQAADLYLRQAREDGDLLAIEERFFSPPERLDLVDMMHFQARMRERLPHYLPFFQEAADQHDLDWRLLVAMGYQESHWDPFAVSPTGVRGVMMLTLNTARSVGVDDRVDPLQSIRGGAEYFVRLRNRLPERIAEPDRTWFTLAAYNIGMGHLEDARRLTEQQGGNPDYWLDVRDRLPMLAQEQYHRHTRYGYARGFEAKAYVDNIQRFFETLVWMDTRSHPLLAEQFITAP
ncbi:MAG: membrane-bound lytic murein transglycosylase MltF [Pseudomonadota bacterium]